MALLVAALPVFAQVTHYHKPVTTVSLAESERLLAEKIRHEFGLKNATLPEVYPGLVLAARKEAQRLLEAGEAGLESWNRGDLRGLLRDVGVSDYRVRGGLSIGSDIETLRPQLLEWARQTTDGGWNRLGIGVAVAEGRMSAVVLLTRHVLNLDPVPRQLDKPGHVRISGQTGMDVRKLSIHVTRPSGSVATIFPTRIASGAFNQAVELKERGEYRLELVVDEGRGPLVAALLAVCVERCTHRRFLPDLPVPAAGQISAARRYVRDWTNAFRRQNGLPELLPHDGLETVIQQFVQTIAYGDALLHSDTNGDGPGERVRKAGIQIWALGENLGRNSHLDILMQKLAESPAHRQNLLSPQYTHIGVGLVFHPEEQAWTVGQLFAVPVAVAALSVGEAKPAPQNWQDAINAERKKVGLPALPFPKKFSAMAAGMLRAERKNGQLDTERLKGQVQVQLNQDPNRLVRQFFVLQVLDISELSQFSAFVQSRWTLAGMAFAPIKSGGYVVLILLGDLTIQKPEPQAPTP